MYNVCDIKNMLNIMYILYGFEDDILKYLFYGDGKVLECYVV